MSSKTIVIIAVIALFSVSFVFLANTNDDSSAAVGDTFDYGGLSYEVTREGLSDEVKVTGFSGDTVENLVIPATVTPVSREYKVTAIEASAFATKGVKTVNLGTNVKDIGALAFTGCVQLTSVTGEAVTDIGESSFSGCVKLVSFTGNNLKVIGVSAFTGCIKLESINLSNVTRIWDFSFMECRALEDVEFSSLLVYIGSYAFYDTGLTSVSIPSATLQIGGSAFNKCSNLSTIDVALNLRYKIESGALIEKTGKKLITLPQKYDIPNNGHYTIPSDVEVIEDGAFDGCDKLKTVLIQSSLNTIGDGAFRNCPNLATFTIVGNTNFRVVDNCLYSYDRSTIYCVPQNYSGEFVAPAALTTVKPYSFADCASITSVDISNATTIGKYAFTDCYGMNTMYVNKDANIGAMAFDLGSLGHLVDCDIRSTGTDFIGLTKTNAFTTLHYYLPVTFTLQNPPSGAVPPGTTYVEKNGTLNIAPIKAMFNKYGYTTYIDGVLSEENSIAVGTTAHTVSFNFDGTAWYTLTINTNGGVPYSMTTDLKSGEALPEIQTPTKDGYKFISWSPAIPATMPAKDLTIEAIWVKIVPKGDIVTDGDTKKVTVNDNTAEISRDVINALTDSTSNVQIGNGNASIKMDKGSFEKLTGTGEFIFSIEKSTGVKNAKAINNLSDAKKKIAEKATILDISFTTNGSTSGLGTATISVPYSLASGQSADKITVYCITDAGELEELKSSYSGGTLTIETTHFSTFAVCSESLTEEPNSGSLDIILVIGVAVGAIVVIGAIVFIVKRR